MCGDEARFGKLNLRALLIESTFHHYQENERRAFGSNLLGTALSCGIYGAKRAPFLPRVIGEKYSLASNTKELVEKDMCGVTWFGGNQINILKRKKYLMKEDRGWSCKERGWCQRCVVI